MRPIRILTIGFTQKTAQEFFTILRGAQIKRIVDVRLNNTSQLAGFTKGKDLAYFVKEILGGQYHHLIQLAPTKEMLNKYQRDNNWGIYETEFMALLDMRKIENNVDMELLKGPSVLLCSEKTAEKCHRRLVAKDRGDAVIWRKIDSGKTS